MLAAIGVIQNRIEELSEGSSVMIGGTLGENEKKANYVKEVRKSSQRGLAFLNKEVSSAVIPDGFVCTFFEQFGCESALRGGDTTVLTGGTWTFTSVPGLATNVNFNDLASSFQCSPL
ncbi:hypothetical protein CVT26_006573 [Gymnopilus dilepis]|uniref:Uncharacterized protein n=1 Tax=Gymnopilus dilepis TaxID=231916 RepID=A0A409Y2W1_9AGAR|nr:hypothetical protein CVT26_006573 [Gymnopilus dilepis]